MIMDNRRYGLIGREIGYSMSKELHERLFSMRDIPATFDIIDIENIEDNIERLARDYDGFNVTKPYKVAIMDYLDEVDEMARAIGSVNTVVKKDGRLIGHNTDLDGLIATFDLDGVDIAHKRCLVIGYGGVSKTVIYALHMRNASVINITGRNEEKIDALMSEMQNIGIEMGKDMDVSLEYDIVVNATSLGTSPDHHTPIDVSSIQGIEYYFDLVYSPRRTRLLTECEQKGIKVRDGLYMLVMQAVKSQEYYLGVTFTDSEIFDVYLHLAGEIFMRQLKNDEKKGVILVGFMGSGKSSVGKRLAEIIGLEHIDTDVLIERRYGAISDMFEEHGEEYFRQVERGVITVASEKRAVISTGGGIVMHGISRLIIEKSPCKVFYLSVPFESARDRVKGSDRPLFRVESEARSLYEYRDPLYREIADVVIDADRSIDDVVDSILRY